MDSLALLASQRVTPEPHYGRPFFWPLIFLMLILLVLAVTMLGEPPVADISTRPTPTEDATRDPRVYTVGYKYGVFSPTNLRIHAGDTVRWHNESPLSIRVVAQLQSGQRTPEFDSVGPVPADGYFAYTFAKAGIYGYYNPSSSNESGVIIVR
jgi:plastocyanin